MHSRHCKEDHAFVALLKACAKKKDLRIGARLYADILKKGLIERNPYIGNGVIGMYAECGELLDAQQVLERLPARHVAAWNALIAGYVHHGRSSEAIECFECMQSEGLSPDAVTFCFILKACGHTMDIGKGEQVHGKIVDRGLPRLLREDVVLGTALVEMYAKCGRLAKAREAFEELLPIRDAVAWNALIAGYVESGQGYEVLECFEKMKGEGRASADAATFLFALKACSMTGDLEKGRGIHGEIERRGLLEEDLLLGTSLVDMYTKCGDLDRAQQVLEGLPRRDEASWNALIAGYTQQEGQGHKALSCFERMGSEGFCADAVTFTCLLKACGAEGAIDKGQRIHEEIVARGLLEKDAVLGNALVSMYARCGAILEAHRVLKELPMRSAAAWSALIAGYAQLGRDREALSCFEEMQREEGAPEPDAIALIRVLKACGSMGSIEAGMRIHGQILRLGLLGKDALLGAALVEMYARCKMLAKARRVLDDLPTSGARAWNAMISAYAQQGQAMEALACFRQMLQREEEGPSPDAATFVAALRACGSAGSGDIGQGIHDEIVGRGLLGAEEEEEEDAPLLATALIDMYAKCGMLARAQQVLEELPDRHVSAWNALISAYAQRDECREALNCVDRMKITGLAPNAITLICALKACGSIGALGKGKQIHGEQLLVNRETESRRMAVENALVDMYAKCGAFAKAVELLEGLPVRNLVSWSALISGYAQQGHVREALSCFEAMKAEGISPDDVTFLSLLNACTRSGRIDEATMLFEGMIAEHGIAPTAEHCTCIAVNLACFGRLQDAISIFKVMLPSAGDASVWVALIAASRKCGNLALARLAFDETGLEQQIVTADV